MNWKCGLFMMGFSWLFFGAVYGLGWVVAKLDEKYNLSPVVYIAITTSIFAFFLGATVHK